METLITLNKIVTVLFVICYGYQLLYIPLSLWKRKQVLKPQPMVNRYAVLICARNERTVIADLIDCLKHQSYPQQLLDIYVMADNCTDDTAEIARRHGATVFERHNQIEVGKGFALNALLQRIWEHDR
ncbi:MAG: glycosyltransferase, partial [Erysipelotrichaceae bacterium]|nr:glycosyltransferase [Erysipelotrichaceae bacterium]